MKEIAGIDSLILRLRTTLLALPFLLASCAPIVLSPDPEPPPVPEPDPEPLPFFFTVDPPPAFSFDRLRIATLNTEFLFDGIEPEGRASFPHKGDTVLAREHRQRVGRLIKMLDSDIVALQEVEHEDVVRDMLEENFPAHGYDVHFIRGRDTFTRQNVALISRVSIDTLGRTDERSPVEGTETTSGVSKNAFARFSLDDVPVTLVNLHLIALASNPQRRPQREAQARVINELIRSEMAEGREIIVVGDFNDFDADVADFANTRPVTSVLAIIKALNGERLLNVMKRVPQHKRFTNHWDRNSDGEVQEDELSAIDHILLSPGLFNRLLEVHYVHAHHPAEMPDHFPVVITLDFARPVAE